MEIISRFRSSADAADDAQARLDALLTPAHPADLSGGPRPAGWVPDDAVFTGLPPAARVTARPPAALPSAGSAVRPAASRPPAAAVPGPLPSSWMPLGEPEAGGSVWVPAGEVVAGRPAAPPGSAAATADPVRVASAVAAGGWAGPEPDPGAGRDDRMSAAGPDAERAGPVMSWVRSDVPTAGAAAQEPPAEQAGPQPDGSGRSGSARSGPGSWWSRKARRWLPEVLVQARVDPGRRATGSLLVVALAGAVLAALLGWRARPAAVPVAAPEVAGASAPVVSAPVLSAVVPAPIGAAPSAPASVTASGAIVVAVAGRVRRPGVVTLPAGARVVDAVQAAGGALPGADLGLLNLARRLSDGDLVAVGVPGAPTGGSPGAPPAAGAGESGPTGSGARVDLNAATAEQFDALPGIGPVLAQRIVEWRSAHGRFESVDQLREVDGIGAAKFAQLRDQVTV